MQGAQDRIEARRYKRVALKAFAAVSAAARADLLKEYNATCVDIGEGGCCLQMDALLSGADIDFGVRVGIDLPDHLPRLLTAGRVAWLRQDNKEAIARYFVGIEFKDLKPQDKDRIRKFVQNQVEIL